jgi:hypothetical protein
MHWMCSFYSMFYSEYGRSIAIFYEAGDGDGGCSLDGIPLSLGLC